MAETTTEITSKEDTPKASTSWFSWLSTLWHSYPASLLFGLCGIGAFFAALKGPDPDVLPAVLSVFLGVALDMLRETRRKLGEVTRWANAVEAANAAAIDLFNAIHEDTQHLIAARTQVTEHSDLCFQEIGKTVLKNLRQQTFNAGDDYLVLRSPWLSNQGFIAFWKYCLEEQEKHAILAGDSSDQLAVWALHTWDPSFWTGPTGARVLEISNAFIKAGGTITRIMVQESDVTPSDTQAILEAIKQMTAIGITTYYIHARHLPSPPPSFAVLKQPDGRCYSITLDIIYQTREPRKAYVRRDSWEVRDYLRTWKSVKRCCEEMGHTPFTKETPATTEQVTARD